MEKEHLTIGKVYQYDYSANQGPKVFVLWSDPQPELVIRGEEVYKDKYGFTGIFSEVTPEQDRWVRGLLGGVVENFQIY